MKKYPYLVAAACVLVGAVGFASIFATNQSQKREEELAKNQQKIEESQREEDIVQITPEPSEHEGVVIDQDLDPVVDNTQVETEEPEEVETPVDNIVQETLHFDPHAHLQWPVEGSTLIDYSMNATVFFPTLQQYQYSPAMVLEANVNDKVYFIAKGKIVNIDTSEETGCTVTQDLGDGYTAVYGQLKELNFRVGDIVEAGQVVGYVSEPTKYYSVEGSNVYLQIRKDGEPIDPKEVLP